MRKVFAGCVCLFFLMLGVFWAQGKQPQQEKTSTPTASAAPAKPAAPQFVISPEDKARKNPVKFTEASVEKGKSLYLTQCAMCHGKAGDGKGDLAALMHLNLPDFTNPATLSQRTDGELYAMINSGAGAMPSEVNRMKPEAVWDLVNFLRSLEGRKPEKSRGNRAKKG